MVVGFGILLIHEVGIVGTHQFDAILMGQLNQHLVGFFLHGECLAVGTDGGVFHLVTLQLQIVVVAKHPLVPLNGLAGSGNVAIQNLLGHLAGNTCRTDDESFVVFLQVLAVRTWTHVEAVYPRTTHQLDEVLVALIVLGQHNQVITALMLLVVFQQLRTIARHVHLTTKDGLEGLQTVFLAAFVDAADIVVKLLDAEHVAMIGYRHASHAVAYGLVNQAFDARLTVQDRVVCMYMQMYEIFHKCAIFSFLRCKDTPKNRDYQKNNVKNL